MRWQPAGGQQSADQSEPFLITGVPNFVCIGPINHTRSAAAAVLALGESATLTTLKPNSHSHRHHKQPGWFCQPAPTNSTSTSILLLAVRQQPLLLSRCLPLPSCTYSCDYFKPSLSRCCRLSYGPASAAACSSTAPFRNAGGVCGTRSSGNSSNIRTTRCLLLLLLLLAGCVQHDHAVRVAPLRLGHLGVCAGARDTAGLGTATWDLHGKHCSDSS